MAHSITYGLLILLFAALPISPISLAKTAAEINPRQNAYTSGSWGLGIVIPEGSQYADGRRLSWENVKEVTAVVHLPSINHTDNTIYVILSAMAQDGSILQIAAGIHPKMSSWLAYAFFIQNLQSYPQSYTWALNSSKPEMTAGDWITLSIYLSSKHWGYRLADMSTKEGVSGLFMYNVTPSFKTGEQEVFALESYTYTSFVFENMNALILNSLLVDGDKITKGWFYYGDWDSTHNPLFVVGGRTPPPFISIRRFDNDTVVWSYFEWRGSEQPFPSIPYRMLALTLTIFFAAVGVMIFTTIYKKRKKNENRGQERGNQSKLT